MLTAPNRSPVTARSLNASAPALYVCSDSAFGSNVTLSWHIFLAYALPHLPKDFLAGSDLHSSALLYGLPKLRNPIRIP